MSWSDERRLGALLPSFSLRADRVAAVEHYVQKRLAAEGSRIPAQLVVDLAAEVVLAKGFSDHLGECLKG